MKLMYKEDGGFHNFRDEEIEQAVKDGWIDGEPVRARILAAKGAKHVHAPAIDPVSEPATINAQPEKRHAGRPRKFSDN